MPFQAMRLRANSAVATAWFDIVLWTGTGVGSFTYTGLNLSNGGLVWVKRRNASGDHALYFKQASGGTVRAFSTNNTTAPTTPAATLDPTGFTVPNNIAGATYVAYVFKKQIGAFDIATWTGNVTNRTVAHSLGVAPKMMFTVQATGTKLNYLQHVGLAATLAMRLDSNAVSQAASTLFNNTYATSSVLSLGTSTLINGSGIPGFAFLFGGSDVAASNYTGTGGTQNISIGFDPRFLLLKRDTNAQEWGMFDTTRQPLWVGNSNRIIANTSAAEGITTAYVTQISGGFGVLNAYNTLASNNVYLAIK